MALSPAHRLGQIVGDELEAAMRKPLSAIAKEYGLYLDYKGVRHARGRKRKVSWVDSLGNAHDLDYVFEEGGSESVTGKPRAFIETAWRRYTKHSRNKAQEIQGALKPLAITYRDYRPFLGAVLAGDFTEGALAQLQSNGFHFVYCPYDTIVDVFANAGVDISSEEDTSEKKLQSQVDLLEALNNKRLTKIRDGILQAHANEFDSFFDALRCCFDRRIERILVLTLFGKPHEFSSVSDATQFIMKEHPSTSPKFVRYEINIRYTNGDNVSGAFEGRVEALEFLSKFERVVH